MIVPGLPMQAYFDLIDQLDAAGNFDPDQLELVLAELYAAPDAEADGSLQFMTLHKSKGLEFDTVILPGLHRQPRNNDASLLLWEEVQIGGLDSATVLAIARSEGYACYCLSLDYHQRHIAFSRRWRGSRFLTIPASTCL